MNGYNRNKQITIINGGKSDGNGMMFSISTGAKGQISL
jgi:hypothetical protein